MKKTILSSLAFLILGLSCSQNQTPHDLAAGKAKFDQYCATCHGSSGKGDGPAGAALNPKPRNFTDASLMGQKSDAQLAKVIKEGGAASGLSPLMVAWGSVLSDQDIANIVAYIRTFK